MGEKRFFDFVVFWMNGVADGSSEIHLFQIRVVKYSTRKVASLENGLVEIALGKIHFDQFAFFEQGLFQCHLKE